MKNANLVSLRSKWQLVVILSAVLTLAGCTDRKPSTAAESSTTATTAPKTVADWFPVKLGEETVRMQLAVSEPEMEHGLMQRRDLAPDEGMIFVYDRPQQMNFWMKNTPTPLDIGYFTGDGVLHEVWPMYAFDETAVPSRSDQIQFCLEMNLGWFKGHNVKSGTQLDLKALGLALRARGFDPTKFGLK